MKVRGTGPDYTKYDLTIGDEVMGRQWKRNLWHALDGELDSEEFCEAAEASVAEGQRRFEPHRWFCKDGQVIHCKGRTYAFTNQWGGKAIDAVQDLAKRFPAERIGLLKSEDNNG